MRPTVESSELTKLAAQIVTDLDAFRASTLPAELEHRRAAGLTARQDHNLMTWGYPYVLEDFHFHLTLSGQLKPTEGAKVLRALEPHINSVLPAPFAVDHITLMGQTGDGMFHEMHRYALTG